MPETSLIETSIQDGIGTITLNSPKTLNAMTVDMMKQLTATLEAWELDNSVRVMVLQGKGRAFSAGADKEFLNDIQEISPFEIKSIIYRHFAGGTKQIRDFPNQQSQSCAVRQLAPVWN